MRAKVGVMRVMRAMRAIRAMRVMRATVQMLSKDTVCQPLVNFNSKTMPIVKSYR